jgi:hypothetical protein
MKKIININFHSRVIPIEETAYDILQQYVESLRRYFANEEGREEIISDIENRFSELFADTLKKGAACITDDDVNASSPAWAGRKSSKQKMRPAPPPPITARQPAAGAGSHRCRHRRRYTRCGPPRVLLKAMAWLHRLRSPVAYTAPPTTRSLAGSAPVWPTI